MKKICLALMLAALAACGGEVETVAPVSTPVVASEPQAQTRVIFDLRDIVRRPREQVEQIVGAAVSDCASGKYGLSCEYRHGETDLEIVYINGVADWITIKNNAFNPFDVPYQLGMEYEKATFQSTQEIRYDGRYGLKSLSVFLAGNRVDYVYIKSVTD